MFSRKRPPVVMSTAVALDIVAVDTSQPAEQAGGIKAMLADRVRLLKEKIAFDPLEVAHTPRPALLGCLHVFVFDGFRTAISHPAM